MAETAHVAAHRLSAPAIRKGFKSEALHEYANADGQPIFWRIRLKNPETGEKWIRPMYENGNGFELGEPKFGDAGKPLYGLDRIAAADPAIPIYIVEGEKAADALLELGAIATTSGSADSADRADWTPLRSRTCILWPDNDDPGRGYAGNVAAILQGLACSLLMVDVGALDLPPKGDARDWAQANPDATLTDLQALAAIAPKSGATAPTEAKPQGTVVGVPADAPTVGGALTLALAMQDLEFVAAPILTKGQKGTLTAHPGHGKSTLFSGLCVAHALSRQFGPITPEADGLVYFVSAEDLHGTRNKMLGEAARHRLDDDERNLLDARLRWVHVETSATASVICEAIERDAAGRDVALIFVDTGPALFCGDDENDNIALRNFVESFGLMAKLPGNPATVLAWHPSKGATADRLEPRGASAIKAVCDFCLTLWKDDDRVTLGYTKVRGQHFEPIEGRLSTVELVAASGAHYFAPIITLDAEERAERSDAREAREAILLRMYATRVTPATVRDLATAAGISRTAVGRHLQHLSTARPVLAAKDPVDDRYTLTKAGEARAKELADRSKDAYENARDPQ